jgi:hypothetical protein
MCTLLYDVQYAMYNTMYIVYTYMLCIYIHGLYYVDIYNTYMNCTLDWMKPQSLSYTHVM